MTNTEPKQAATSELKSEVQRETDQAAAAPEGQMWVKVYAPFKIYYDDLATSVSAVNDTGPFDILAGHHNFMTLLNEGDVIVRADKGEEKIGITHGVMHVKKDRVVVFLDV